MKEEELIEVEEKELDDDFEEEKIRVELPDNIQELMSNQPCIELDMEDYDEKKFRKGIEDYSYLSGALTALFNAGVSEAAAMEYILSKESMKHSLDKAKLTKEMNVEIAGMKNIKAEAFDL